VVMLNKLYGPRFPSWWNDAVMLIKYALGPHHDEIMWSC
jgi:hypothetical protein